MAFQEKSEELMTDAPDLRRRRLPVVWDVLARMWAGWTIEGELSLLCTRGSSRVMTATSTFEHGQVAPQPDRV